MLDHFHHSGALSDDDDDYANTDEDEKDSDDAEKNLWHTWAARALSSR